MKAPCDAALMRIFLGDDSVEGHLGLFDQVMRAGHHFGLAGVTVIRGVRGYGAAIRDIEPLLTLADRPVIIELIDSEMNLRAFLQSIHSLVSGALVTIQAVSVVQIGAGHAKVAA